MLTPGASDPAPQPPSQNPIDQAHTHDPLVDLALPSASPQLSAAQQSYASIYGPRFNDCHFTLIFNLEERVPSPANGGSRRAFLDDCKAQMNDIRRAVQQIIVDEGLTGKVQHMNFLSSLGMATMTSNGAAADTLLGKLTGKPYFSSMADSTGSIAYIPENPPSFPDVWVAGGGFVPGQLPTGGPAQTVSRYSFHMSSNDASKIRSDMDALTRNTPLAGQLGIDYRQADTGTIALTCLPSELSLLSGLPGLTRIQSMEPSFSGGRSI